MQEEVFHVDFQKSEQPQIVTVHSEEAAISTVRSRFPDACFGEWEEPERGGRCLSMMPVWANDNDMRANEMQDLVVAFIVDETPDEEED